MSADSAAPSSAASTGRGLALGVIVAALALAAGTLAALLGDVSRSDHERYSNALRRALELDARLGEEVAKARLGNVTHYDELVRISDRITANSAELQRLPGAIDGDQQALLERDLGSYRESVDEKNQLVERFKTEHAVLRNSLRALPHNVGRLVGEIPEERQDLRLAIEHLLRDSLMLVLAPADMARDRAVQCGLARLGQGGECEVTPLPQGELSPLAREHLGSVLAHAELIRERSRSVAELVDRFMAVPVARDSRRTQETYIGIHDKLVRDARTRWMLVVAAAIALLVLLSALIIARMHASGLELREAKTMLESALETLAHERDREVELANLKSRFVSMTSHEFRTPLSVILSSAELLEAYGPRWDESKKQTHLERIQEASKKMSQMLDGVLLIGRAESGMLQANPRRLRPKELAATVVEEVCLAAGKDRRLEYRERGGSEAMWLDENLLRHVLTNLLTNAFKYSPVGSTVSFVVQQEPDGVVFEVADEGIGIPEDELDHLFDAFHRCSNASAIPGTGLGLAVVKKSVDVHQGTIEVESRVGSGTRFAVRLPELEEAA